MLYFTLSLSTDYWKMHYQLSSTLIVLCQYSVLYFVIFGHSFLIDYENIIELIGRLNSQPVVRGCESTESLTQKKTILRAKQFYR